MSKATYSATMVLVCFTLVACDGVDLGVEGTDSNNPDGSQSLVTNNNAEDLEDARFGDEYWAELAQNFPAFVRPPEFAAAHDASENINLGRWGDVIDWPEIATGAANLPDGRILTWSSTQEDDFGGKNTFTHGSIFDPVTETFTDNPNNQHNMFCAGISMLGDGSIFTAGGGATIATTSIFQNGSWSLTDSLNQNRWYPHTTTLPSGQAVVSLGTNDTPLSEIWTEGQGWSTLSNVNLQTVLDDTSVKNNLRDWFPAMNVAPDGRLFHPGPSSELFSIDLYTDGQSFTSHGKRESGDPHRLYNTTVMYDIGKMLIAGGGQPALNSALTIDINGSTPIVTATESMTHARSMQDSVVLPNGEVLVIGGNSSGIQFSDEGTQIVPEIWNPDTGQWTLLAPHNKPRNYHTTALLLKDGRVASMGGGLCGNCATNQQNGEIYEPPYLFNADGTRAVQPEIASGASEAAAGDTISLTATAGMQSFAMLRLVALTHHHSTDQRFVPLSFTETQSGNYSIQLPANSNVLIPGYYWVFALDANGVPSSGHTLLISTTAERVPEPPASVVYEYYEGEWNELPDFDSLTPVATGQSQTFSLGASQQDDNFGFRFTANFNLSQAGNYTFYTTSDDGSQLFINGQMVVDNDGTHGSREEEGSINLAAGNHEVVVIYFEKSGGSNLVVEIEGPALQKQPLGSLLTPLDGSVAPVEPVTPATPGNTIDAAISYDYYEGDWRELPDFAALTPVLSGELDEFSTSPARQNTFFGFRYVTTLYVPVAQQYTFYTESDDGSALYVNNQLVVDNDGLHGSREEQGTIALAAGEHDIVVEYFNRTGGQNLEVRVANASSPKQTLIPSTTPDQPAVEPVDPVVPVVPVAPADNLLSNGDFQNTLDQWSVCGGDATATADGAVLSNDGCLFQEFAVIPQATYTLVCNANATGFASMQLSASDVSFAALATDIAPVLGTTTAQFVATVTAPDASAQGVVTLYAEDQASFNNCAITVDDSAVVPATVDPVVAESVANDLLINASFDNGLNGWESCGGQQVVNANGIDGSGAVNLTDNGCLFQEFAVAVGTEYELNCTGLSGSDFSSVTLAFNDNLFQAVESQQVPVTSSVFANTNISLTAPVNAARGVVTLFADSDATFDSCGIVASGLTGGVTPPVLPPAPVVTVDPTDNLLTNGDFANGATDWLTCGGASSVDAQGTNNSDGLVLGTTACIFQEFTAEPGKEYALSCSGRATSFASLTLGFSDAGFNTIASSQSAVPGTAFSTVTATETAPADTAQGAVTLYADDSAVFDDCTVVEL